MILKSLSLWLVMALVITSPSLAVKLRDGKTYFDRVPQLINAETTFEEVRAFSPTYLYELALPEGQGEALQRIEILQEEGGGTIDYNFKNISAFTQDQQNNRRSVVVNGRLITDRLLELTFPEGITPGQKLTIVIKPHRNPDYSGVYLFRVTAFPAGNVAHGQFLGYGRFNFRDGSYFSSFRFW